MKITITIETDRRPDFRDEYELWLWNKRKQRYTDRGEPDDLDLNDWWKRLNDLSPSFAE